MSPRSSLRDVTGLWAPSVLMPDWNQVQVSRSSPSGQTLRDLADHRGGGMEGDLVLGDADGDGLDTGGAADVGDARHFFDMRDFLGGFDHPEAHRGAAMSTNSMSRELGLEKVQRVDRDVVELDAEAFDAAGQAADGVEVIVLAPVGVCDVPAAEGAPPGLAAVDAGADRGGDVMVDEQAVAAAELAVEEVGVIIDAVVGGEERGVDPARGHVGAHCVEPAAHLGRGEGRRDGIAVAGVVLKSLALHGSLAVAAGSGGFRNRSPARRSRCGAGPRHAARRSARPRCGTGRARRAGARSARCRRSCVWRRRRRGGAGRSGSRR